MKNCTLKLKQTIANLQIICFFQKSMKRKIWNVKNLERNPNDFVLFLNNQIISPLSWMVFLSKFTKRFGKIEKKYFYNI